MNLRILEQTFADGRDEESFSRSNGITNGSKSEDEEKASCNDASRY